MPDAIEYRRLNPPERTLLGPDLSNASPRARQGLLGVLQGANDPFFLSVIEGATALLQHLWGTTSADTFFIPGSEETALEAALVNVLEPGDAAVVGVSGFFGERMAQVIERVGAIAIRVHAAPGAAVSADDLERALARQRVKLLAVLHGDGSTGVEQSLDSLGGLAHAHDALLLVDTRWTLAGLELHLENLGIDIAIAGSQKCLSGYPGLGLISFSERAGRAYDARTRPVMSWSLDLAHLREFRSDERTAQTLPAPVLYALTEMLQLTYEQGMAYRVQRHINRRDALVTGLETLGLRIYAQPEFRLPTVTCIEVPGKIDADRVRDKLRRPYRFDIGGGLGDLHGKLWRVGIMSHSAQPTFLLSFLTLLEIILNEEGYTTQEPGAAGRILLTHLDP